MIWIVGYRGMLGHEMVKALAGRETVVSDREVDITEPGAIGRFGAAAQVPGKKIDWIVNCSGYTAVEKAEEDRALCTAINETGVRNLARYASSIGAKMVHISTDYVFSGTSPEPLPEDAPKGPTCVYGVTKLAGERAVEEENPRHFIIRTAWLYGKDGNNFVYTMLKLANTKETARVVNDQTGSPTRAKSLAALVALLVERNAEAYGVYQFSGEGRCTWYEFAREIQKRGAARGLATMGCRFEPCTSDEYPAKVKRPAYSLLSKEKVKATFGITVRDWKDELDDFLDEIAAGMEREPELKARIGK